MVSPTTPQKSPETPDVSCAFKAKIEDVLDDHMAMLMHLSATISALPHEAMQTAPLLMEVLAMVNQIKTANAQAAQLIRAINRLSSHPDTEH